MNSDSTGYSSAEEEETMPGGQVRVRVWVSTEQELGNDIGAMWFFGGAIIFYHFWLSISW